MESHNKAVRVFQEARGGGGDSSEDQQTPRSEDQQTPLLVSCAAILDPTMLVVINDSGTDTRKL